VRVNVRVAVRGVLWVLGAGCLFLPVFDDPPLQTGAYVQDVRRDSAVVAMMTAAPVQLEVQLVEIPGPGDVDAVDLRKFGEPGPARRHVFHLDRLQAWHHYGFSVHDAAGNKIDGGLFRTPSDDDRAPVRFDVLGDSGGQPPWVWLQTSPLFYLPARWGLLSPSGTVARTGEQIRTDDPDFVLHVGDVIYPWGHAGHYASGFFRPFAESLRHCPWYIVLGNHDTLDDDGRQALANFVLPVNEITGDERMYSIVWGPVRVIVLDLNEEGHDRQPLPPVDANHPSVGFLRSELTKASEPWIFVTSHYPIESASRQGDRADLIEHVLPLLLQYGVNLYLSGHDHTYQRLEKKGDLPLVVSGGGGKSLYEVGEHPDKVVALSKYNHCTVMVHGRDLTLRAIGLDDGELDKLELHQDAAAAARVREVNPERARRIEALLK
jgi:hypothetical protein